MELHVAEAPKDLLSFAINQLLGMPHQAANLVAAQLAHQQRAAGVAGGVLPAGVAAVPGIIGALAAVGAVPMAALDPSATVAVALPLARIPF